MSTPDLRVETTCTNDTTIQFSLITTTRKIRRAHVDGKTKMRGYVPAGAAKAAVMTATEAAAAGALSQARDATDGTARVEKARAERDKWRRAERAANITSEVFLGSLMR